VAIRDLLTDSVDILRRTPVTDQLGSADYTEEVFVEGLPCRIRPLTGYERQAMGTTAETTTHRMYCEPPDIVAERRAEDVGKYPEREGPHEALRDIRPRDVVIKGIRRFQIVSVRAWDEQSHHWVLDLVEHEPKRP
jgi:hypothetical protein